MVVAAAAVDAADHLESRRKVNNPKMKRPGVVDGRFGLQRLEDRTAEWDLDRLDCRRRWIRVLEAGGGEGRIGWEVDGRMAWVFVEVGGSRAGVEGLRIHG